MSLNLVTVVGYHIKSLKHLIEHYKDIVDDINVVVYRNDINDTILDEVTDIIKLNSNLLERLVNIKKINSGEGIDKPAQSAVGVIQNLEFFIPLSGLIDINKEIERLQKQANDLEGRLRAVNKKLNNENFIKRAPNDVVKHEKTKQSDYQNSLTKLLENLNSLKS